MMYYHRYASLCTLRNGTKFILSYSKIQCNSFVYYWLRFFQFLQSLRLLCAKMQKDKKAIQKLRLDDTKMNITLLCKYINSLDLSLNLWLHRKIIPLPKKLYGPESLVPRRRGAVLAVKIPSVVESVTKTEPRVHRMNVNGHWIKIPETVI